MFNHMVYDVFIKNEEDYKSETGLRGTSRFGDDLLAFDAKGLEFRCVPPSAAEVVVLPTAIRPFGSSS